MSHPDLENIVFIDTETTGLDPDLHEIWEVAAIWQDEEHVWQLTVDLGKADPMALKINRYRERILTHRSSTYEFVQEFARLTDGKHLCGSVVSFDEERLRKLLRRHNECPTWHYHIIDVEAMQVGHIANSIERFETLHGEVSPLRDAIKLPWKSDGLSEVLGVDKNQFDRHTALGDARWARTLYIKMMGLVDG